MVRHLGDGSFGVVDLVCHRTTGEERVCKTVSTRGMTRAQLEQMLEEVRILRDLDHPHIVKVHEYAEEREQVELVIILEHVAGGSCDSLLRRLGRPLGETLVAHLVQQLLQAVAYCHERRVVHRDLKPEHMLLAPPPAPAQHSLVCGATPAVTPEAATGSRRLPVCKLIDFGLAAFTKPASASPRVGSPQTDSEAASPPPGDEEETAAPARARAGREQDAVKRVGTPVYMAPEVVQQDGHYSPKADIWSVGVSALELLTGRRAFAQETRAGTYASILRYSDFDALLADLGVSQGRHSPSAVAKDFLRSLLQPNPSLRPSAAEALKHPWLAAACCASPPASPSLVVAAAADRAAEGRAATPPRGGRPSVGGRRRDCAAAAVGAFWSNGAARPCSASRPPAAAPSPPPTATEQRFSADNGRSGGPCGQVGERGGDTAAAVDKSPPRATRSTLIEALPPLRTARDLRRGTTADHTHSGSGSQRAKVNFSLCVSGSLAMSNLFST